MFEPIREFIPGLVPRTTIPANTATVGCVGPQLAEFWRKTLAVVADIGFGMAKAIFPYLVGYRRKSLTDVGANVILATQTKRNILSFHGGTSL
jgi:hypothetical protein